MSIDELIEENLEAIENGHGRQLMEAIAERMEAKADREQHQADFSGVDSKFNWQLKRYKRAGESLREAAGNFEELEMVKP